VSEEAPTPGHSPEMAGYPSIGNRHKISWIFRFHFKQIQIIPFQNSKEKKSKEKKANDDKKKERNLPTTVRLMRLLRVGDFLKSTRHR